MTITSTKYTTNTNNKTDTLECVEKDKTEVESLHNKEWIKFLLHTDHNVCSAWK